MDDEDYHVERLTSIAQGSYIVHVLSTFVLLDGVTCRAIFIFVEEVLVI